MTAEQLMRKQCISRRVMVMLKRTENGITLNGRQIRTVDRLSAGEVLTLCIPEKEGDAVPNPYLIIPKAYEDEDIIAYCKPAGVPVHRSHDHYDDTLENAFAAEYGSIPFRAVNRLDMNTSGLCIAAKNKAAADVRGIEKVYYAVCEGVIEKEILIDAPIARKEGSAILRCVSPEGKPSQTKVIPLETDGRHTLLEIYLLTGRTHQIRVHLSHIGHPLAGDDMYGGSREYIRRQALHCGKMSFVQPVTKEFISIKDVIPDEICELIQSDRHFLL